MSKGKNWFRDARMEASAADPPDEEAADRRSSAKSVDRVTLQGVRNEVNWGGTLFLVRAGLETTLLFAEGGSRAVKSPAGFNSGKIWAAPISLARARLRSDQITLTSNP